MNLQENIDRIHEIMGGVITDSRLEKIVINWLNDKYGDLESYETDKHPNHIFYIKDGKIILEYSKINNFLYVSYDEIWSVLESYFNMNYDQVKEILTIWVGQEFQFDSPLIWSSDNRMDTEL